MRKDHNQSITIPCLGRVSAQSAWTKGRSSRYLRPVGTHFAGSAFSIFMPVRMIRSFARCAGNKSQLYSNHFGMMKVIQPKEAELLRKCMIIMIGLMIIDLGEEGYFSFLTCWGDVHAFSSVHSSGLYFSEVTGLSRSLWYLLFIWSYQWICCQKGCLALSDLLMTLSFFCFVSQWESQSLHWFICGDKGHDLYGK